MVSRKIREILICILMQYSFVLNKRVIWDDVIPKEKLESKIQIFNDWYTDLNGGEVNVEARYTNIPEQTRMGLFAKKDLRAEEVYLTIDRSKMMKGDLVYETKIGPLIRSLEEKIGYDDYRNFVFYFLHEMNNPDSVWNPYLDLIPRQPTSIACKYWEKKSWMEEELNEMPILSKKSFNLILEKIIDHKLLIEKKAKTYYDSLVADNTDILDRDFYNEENIQWACFIMTTRLLIYIDNKAFLDPMLDFVNYRESWDNPSRKFNAEFNEDSTIARIRIMEEVGAHSEIFENLGYSNDIYLLYHGHVLSENSHDCVLLPLSFNRPEDELKEQRKAVFSKHFLFDKNDEITECVSLKNPFPSRLMFFYYTVLLEETTLNKPDHQIVGLENERFVLEHVGSKLNDLLKTNTSKLEYKLNTQSEIYKENIKQYLVETRNLIVKLIEVYNVQVNIVNKFDTL